MATRTRANHKRDRRELARGKPKKNSQGGASKRAPSNSKGWAESESSQAQKNFYLILTKDHTRRILEACVECFDSCECAQSVLVTFEPVRDGTLLLKYATTIPLSKLLLCNSLVEAIGNEKLSALCACLP